MYGVYPYYAGIGSRQTPADVCAKFTELARAIASYGYCLRSGGADGADHAFEMGAHDKEILRPRHSTDQAEAIAARIHPAWHLCDVPARKLHGRNVQIILGPKLDEPVQFVLTWTKDPTKGGTRTGIEVAKEFGIPVFNFATEKGEEEFHIWFEGIKNQ